ncbi:hypothetical protein HD806DRAFT_526642 [Xylariaceae sp. AK1471]|nr:hypothetical protein HD806DRAFT_526642 [Xylariaceae sp. AK1471]
MEKVLLVEYLGISQGTPKSKGAASFTESIHIVNASNALTDSAFVSQSGCPRGSNEGILKMDEYLNKEGNRDTKSPERSPDIPNISSVSQTNQEPRCDSPHPSEISQPSSDCTNPPQSATSDESSSQLEEQVQQEQQLPQQSRDLEHSGEEQQHPSNQTYTGHQSPNLRSILSIPTPPSTQPPADTPTAATELKASVPAATASQSTQTSCPTPVTPAFNSTAAPPGAIPAAPSGTNPALPQRSSTATAPGLPPTGYRGLPTNAPPGPPHYQHFNPGLKVPSNMAAANGWSPLAQSLFCPPPHLQQAQHQAQQAQPQQTYWYYYPGTVPAPAASVPNNATRQSPWWSGTSHYLTSPPPQAPQVYSVEPAYIMPQATYYQAPAPAPAPAAAPVYYYVAGQPCYYYV